MTSLPKSYDPSEFESRLYAQWESDGAFAAGGQGEPYCILLPPPNVTGTLHMGHAFQHTLMDALIRYHRMRGFDTLWQVGTDHAGIATEMVVARNLAADQLTREGLGRDAFIDKVWEWKQHSGNTIERQMRRLGASGDWSRSVFTMDPMPSETVVECFVRLHEQGLIYRGQRLVNWDPVLKTAISDLEVVSEEEDGFLWSILYPFADASLRGPDGRAGLVVATTRPETLLGDVCVAVHPDDERYTHLIGQTLRLPLCDREIPIIADSYVEREFGTGCVKITPAHDFNDHAIGQRHGFSPINIFTPDAAINDSAPAKYRGQDRYDARKAILADLEALDLLIETKPHKLQVPRGDRTGQVIEPFLTYQWFVKMDQLGRRGLELVENGQIRFVPPNWINTYRHWMENIQDWCISRQLWWGHRIPAWYDDAGGIHVGRDEADARARSGLSDDIALTRDDDVLETWFSSALWPFSTLGWPNPQAMAERGYDRYLPSSVLVTGFDIIFFWVARMVMMTDHFTGQIPFKHVYITGLVRDKDGQKMSKSKGNVLDPIDLIDGIRLDDLITKRTAGLMQPQMAARIEKATRKEFPDGIPAFGADALRFTFASLASHGRDIKFDLSRCEGYKAFCNKLWNAARFVLLNCREWGMGNGASGVVEETGAVRPVRGEVSVASDHSRLPISDSRRIAATDAERWILARLAHTLRDVEAQFAGYRFDLASQALYEFTWNEFCDWFLELAKPALNGSDEVAAASTRHTLLTVLERLLCALHPLIPFVTEEIWQSLRPALNLHEARIMQRPYPTAAELGDADSQAEADIEWLKSVISAIRRLRSDINLPPRKPLALLLEAGGPSDRERSQRFQHAIAFLAAIDSQDWLPDGQQPPPAAAAVIGDLRLLIPLAGLIDLDAERSRLDKDIQRTQSEIDKCRKKLDTPTFVENAPAAVVEQERQRHTDWTRQLHALTEQRQRLG
ncbi:MAG TPA: valine--tRNA ligase [Xanthomonadales bacterium]|nr:valine--tRNA ligase [Xanthomonadales bacterium]